MPASPRPGLAVAPAAGIACAIVGLVLALLLFLTGKDYRETTQAVDRWHASATGLAGYERGFAAAESAHRGFLLTGSGESLARFDAALAQLERERESLARAFAHDAGAHPALAEVERVGGAAVADWRRTVTARDVQTAPADGALPSLSPALAPIDSLRGRVDRALAADAAHARSLATRFAWLAVLVPLLFTASMALFVRWGLRQQDARERLESILSRESEHDPLTGLPTRRLCNEWLAYALAGAKRIGQNVGIMVVGIDADGLPLRSDGIAAEVATRLRAVKRESDLLARTDEHVFVLVAQGVQDGPELAGLAHRLQRVLTEPPLPGEQLAHLHVSVGVALYPHDADDLPGLMAAADAALLDARRSPQRVRFHRETAAQD